MEQPVQIFQLTDENVKEFIKNPSAPHRHEYEEVIVITSGSPCHYIDFKREQLKTPIVVYVAMGKVHQFSPDSETRGWAIRYQNECIPHANFHFYSNFADTINYPVESSLTLEIINTLCEMMMKEFDMKSINYAMLHHLLSALFAKLEAESGRTEQNGVGQRNPELETFNNFLKILEENYRRSEGVEFYAEKLNMSTRNLNAITKKIFDKSVSEIIETRKLTEARRLLLHSTLSVSEIGFDLGYNEKSYFSRVFHKNTGLTPTQYKSQMQGLLA